MHNIKRNNLSWFLILSFLFITLPNISISWGSDNDNPTPLLMDLDAGLPNYQGINCWDGYEDILDDLKDSQEGVPPNIDKDKIAGCLMQSAKTEYPPLIFATSIFSDDSINAVIKGIEIAQNRLGNYGPYHVFLVGNNEKKGFVVDVEKIANTYCASIDKYTEESYLECLKNAMNDFPNFGCCGAAHNPSGGIGQMVRYQSAVFSEDNRSTKEGRSIITSAHEYIHVFQNGFFLWGNDIAAEKAGLTEKYSHGPVWLEEGFAEGLAQQFTYQDGYNNNYENFLSDALDAAIKVNKKHKFTLRDIATRQDQAHVRSICEECQGWLQYETAAIALAVLQSYTGIDTFINKFKSFYSAVPIDGWEIAFEKSFEMSMEEFYIMIDDFMDKPKKEQKKILYELL
tara:strand:+ start:1085 stop:2281 length:1197 start_codon:yes stop_codon:yes gene_type:complete